MLQYGAGTVQCACAGHNMNMQNAYKVSVGNPGSNRFYHAAVSRADEAGAMLCYEDKKQALLNTVNTYYFT